MSSTPPAPRSSRRPQWLSGKRLPWLLVAGAFVLGLLLFALVLGGKDDDAFFHAGGEAGTDAQGQVFEALPTPDAAGGSSIERGLPANDAADTATDERGANRRPPSLDGTPASAPVQPTAPPPAPAARAPSSGATAAARPTRSPRPDYPPEALRRGESGTVLVQVEVDTAGRPADVSVVQSSRSRALDRAAVRAVQRWEFSPALRAGQPVASKVLIPIEFNR